MSTERSKTKLLIRAQKPIREHIVSHQCSSCSVFVQVYLPGFLSSNLYYKYLSDLINSVRADEFVNVSSQGHGGPADNDQSGSNASEGSQNQVSSRCLHPLRGCSLSADI